MLSLLWIPATHYPLLTHTHAHNETHTYSVDCLANLAVDETSAEELIDMGVIDTLQKVLKQNPYNEGLQQKVNKALMAVGKTDRLKQMIMERLDPSVLTRSLRKHVEGETLSSTCNAINMLMVNPEAIEKFQACGLAEALNQSMKNNKNQEDFMQGAARLIKNMTKNQALCADLRNTECFQVCVCVSVCVCSSHET
jgi:superfamily II DNA/RNA helicase